MRPLRPSAARASSTPVAAASAAASRSSRATPRRRPRAAARRRARAAAPRAARPPRASHPPRGRRSPEAVARDPAVAGRFQRALEVAGGVLVGQPRHGGARGARRVVHNLRGRAAREPEVVGELGVVAARALQRLADAPVQQRAASARELGVDRLAHERVGEDGAAGLLADEVRGERGVERLDERLARQPARRREHVEAQLAAGDRGEPEDVAGRLAEPLEPAREHLAHALRHAGRPRLPDLAQDLLDEERVAAGLAPDRAGERSRRVGAEPRRDERVDVALPEAVERDAPHEAVAAQVGQQRAERRRRLVRPGRGEDQHRPERGAREVAQQQQRRAVGPVQVVEHQEHGLPGRRARQQRCRRLEQAVALASRVARRGRAERRQPVGLVGDEAAELGGERQGAQLLARAVSQVRPQRLGERLVRRDRVLVGAAVEDGRPALVSRARELGRQAGLADPRLPGDHDRAGVRRPALLPRGADHPLRRGAAHERAAVAPRQRRRQRQRLAAQLRHERPRLLGRLDPQLAPQHAAQMLERGERRGAVARRGQPADQRAVGVLRQRIDRDQLARDADRVAELAGRLGRVGGAAERVAHALVLAVALGVDPVVGQAVEHRPADERQSLGEPALAHERVERAPRRPTRPAPGRPGRASSRAGRRRARGAARRAPCAGCCARSRRAPPATASRPPRRARAAPGAAPASRAGRRAGAPWAAGAPRRRARAPARRAPGRGASRPTLAPFHGRFTGGRDARRHDLNRFHARAAPALRDRAGGARPRRGDLGA